MLGYLRAVGALALAGMLAVSCGGSDSNSNSNPKAACIPGQQIACTCTNGASGAQKCGADGKSYEPCQCSESDAGVDQASDQSPDQATDSPSEATPDAPEDAPTACVYPSDGLDQQTWPTPTPGSCVGNATFTCDPNSHQMVTTACAAGTLCTTYDVTENPDPNFHPQPGRSYTWAGCIPANATPCSYSWSPMPGYYPPGQWQSSYLGNCNGNDVQYCTMPPLPDDQAYFDLWAGTTAGYVSVKSCAADEACADNPQYPGSPDCYAAPLTPCLSADSHCQGDTLYDCQGYPYQKKTDCATSGQVCREDCNDGLSYQPAECRAPLPSGAAQCDSSTYSPSCVGANTIERCDECFEENGQCNCYAVQHSCNDLGCSFASSCQCADVTLQGATAAQCIDGTKTLCDPSTTLDTCNGNQAQICIGYVSEVDCTKYGEVCQVAGGKAGCTASPAQTCDASLEPSCSGNQITGCCPASGEFSTNSYGVPCVPGQLVQIDCSAFYAPMTCQSAGPLGAMCSL